IDETDVDVFTLRPTPEWSVLPGAELPVPRFGQATVHDTRHDRMIVFGGLGGNRLFGNTRYLSDPAWAALATPFDWHPLVAGGFEPPARHEPVGVYDALRDRAVFFGG